MIDLAAQNRVFSLTLTGLTWLITLAIAPSLYGVTFVVTDEDPLFFPAGAEVVGALPAASVFGQDAPTSLGQSFQLGAPLSLESIFVEYENDTGAADAPNDKSVTMTIFSVLDVFALTHDEPPMVGDILFSESIIFPYVGNTETIAGIQLDSPLALAANTGSAGYMLSFSGGGDPGWEWERDGSSGGSAYGGGQAYEDAAQKLSGGHSVDYVFALSSVALPEPELPVTTDSFMNGDLLAGTTWVNGLAPVGTPPNPNVIHNVVSGHAITANGSAPYTGAGVNIVDGSLTYTASQVQLSSVTVGAGSTVTETHSGAFFLGNISAPELGNMELNGQLSITAEGGADAAIDMNMSGTGTATVNLSAGGTFYLDSATSWENFSGTLQFNGSGDEVLYDLAPGSGMTLEMNSTGINKLSLNPLNASPGNLLETIVFNQPGEIVHAAVNSRFQQPSRLIANADVSVDMTQTFPGNERRMFFNNGLHGAANVTVTGTPTDPTSGSITLNEFEIGLSGQDGTTATHFETDNFSGTLTLNNFVNAEIRDHVPSATVVVNQNARLEFGHRDVESLFTTRVGDVTVNSGGSLEVGYEEDDTHAPYQLQLTTQRGQSGDLTLASGSETIMQISANGANQFDTIAAEGTVTLGGTLELLINPSVPSQTVSCDPNVDCAYTPVDGDMFEIISIVAETLPADLDGNGTVGSEDIAIWDSQYGQTLAAGDNQDFDVTADVDGDGDTDGADLLAIQRDFGASGALTGSITGDFDSIVIVDPLNTLAGFNVTHSVTATSVILTVNAIPAQTAVPEPSACLLAGIALIIGGGARGWGRPRTMVR
ncbi:hypothetical protein [Adhaeretor mobilis]|uniref:PEP-CTERM protein-sorting domain-containing protein n=1 Tax=Adhaeretor mobilis TaxID=1930276 RepID=A0A517MWL1_9BACT|nr:hypothetical protein [Adhaeretor mobilis]QDS99197.1 hypothetical protein HG15A2_24890 [Adhaeretor mobilis]